MHLHDRERLATGIVLALVLHALVALAYWLLDLGGIEPFPEYQPPMYVDLESSFVPEEPPEETVPPEEEPEELVLDEPGTAEGEEVPPSPPPQPETEEPVQVEPAATPEPEPAARPEQRTPEPAPPQPSASREPPPDASAEDTPPAQTQAPPAPPDSRSEPEETYDYSENLSFLYGQEKPEDAAEPEPDDSLFDFTDVEEQEDDSDVPPWVKSMDNSGISTDGMETEEIKQLATKVEQDPEFEALMRRVNDAVERGSVPNPRADASEPTAPSAQSGPATESLGDNAAIQWVGQAGGRGTGGALPTLSASDFPGPVPARLEFVVVFDVDPQGVVVPGSVILQKSSGHTAVDRKVRSAILNWKFLPKPQAETETGVFTLVVERSDIR